MIFVGETGVGCLGLAYQRSCVGWIYIRDVLSFLGTNGRFRCRAGFQIPGVGCQLVWTGIRIGFDPVKGEKAQDVQRLLKYGKEKGVGIWLYLNDVGGRKYPIEKTLKQYGDWGAAGVKYGFMSGTQEEKEPVDEKDHGALCSKSLVGRFP